VRPAGKPVQLQVATSRITAWRVRAVTDQVGRRRRGKQGECRSEHLGLPCRRETGPVTVIRGDGSPGSGSADSPSGRYRGVDWIFPVSIMTFLLRFRC
jgi:hypothetical protein